MAFSPSLLNKFDLIDLIGVGTIYVQITLDGHRQNVAGRVWS